MRHRRAGAQAACRCPGFTFIFATVLLLGASSQSCAQSAGAPAERVDCSALQQQKDRTWIATRETTLQIDGNAITVSSGATPQGSVNGLDIQSEITLQCGRVVPLPVAKPVVLSQNAWVKMSSTQPACMAHATKLTDGFAERTILKESVFVYDDAHSFIIFCTSINVVWMVHVGPPNDTEEREYASQSKFAKLRDDGGW
jgi:hypothetical protein